MFESEEVSIIQLYSHKSKTFGDDLIVSIIGIIVEISNSVQRCRLLKYAIDDGTGVINAIKFDNDKKYSNDCSINYVHVPSHLEEGLQLFSEMTKRNLLSKNYRIGTPVVVEGKLQNFNGFMEILAFSIRPSPNVNFELDRIVRKK